MENQIVENNTVTSHITQSDINTLKQQIEEQKRQQEYQRLSQNLERISGENSQAIEEFYSPMQSPDMEQVLNTQKGREGFIILLIRRLQNMLSPRPAIGGFISLGLTVAIVVLLHKNFIQHIAGWDIHRYLPYLGITVLIAGGLQIIKSGTRTLLLPLLAVIIGGSIASSMGVHDTMLTLQKAVFQGAFICGVIGLIIAVFSID